MRYIVRVKPFPDEAISSYLLRIAQEHHISPKQLLQELGVPRNICTNPHLIDWVDNYDETLIEDLLGIKSKKLLKMTSLNETNKIRLCHVCLREEPYWRVDWKNNNEICKKHRNVMIKKCPKCSNFISSSKPFSLITTIVAFLDQKKSKAPFVATCFHCGYDFREFFV